MIDAHVHLEKGDYSINSHGEWSKVLAPVS